MATNADSWLITVDEFLKMDFGPDRKAELVGGVIRMMGGGTRVHARVQANLVYHLMLALKGSSCRPFGSDMAVRINGTELRYPDVSVYCGEQQTPEYDLDLAGTDPTVVFEVLSPSTKRIDQQAKLPDYQSVRSIKTIVYIDPVGELIRTIVRSGDLGWIDSGLKQVEALELASLGVSIPARDIFARS
jgi:Uma2 family endonuclease